MKYYNDCPNCGNSNPMYKLACGKCKTFLRGKITNLDFGSLIWQVMEEPKAAFIKVIQAEHKNFLVTTFLFTVFKIALTAQILSNIILEKHSNAPSFYLAVLMSFLIVSSLFFLVPLIIKFTGKLFNRDYRYIDVISIFVFSFIPLVLSLIIFTPIEFALFGTYWFLFNPSPILIKPIPSYILFFFEICFIVWNIVLLIIAQNRIYDKTIISIIISLIYITMILGSGLFINIIFF